MTASRIALATARQWAELAPDDLLLLPPLREHDIAAEPALWDDPAVDWSRYDGVLIRSCWDYSWRLPEFLQWLDRLQASGITVWNSPEIIRGNVHKSYLRRLQEAGLGTLPTVWVQPGEVIDLAPLFASHAWEEIVVKPVVSAGARQTFRILRHEAAEFQHRIQALARSEDGLMIQPFLPQICTEGEWSLLFFGGEFSHAVIKRPKCGDFRVQEQHGGTAVLAFPSEGLLKTASLALEILAPGCLYARVDGVISEDSFLIMEVELIEPRLFLAEDEASAGRLAKALAARIRRAA